MMSVASRADARRRAAYSWSTIIRTGCALPSATWNVTPIDFDDVDDPAKMIIDATDVPRRRRVIDAVGFEAKGSAAETVLATMKIEGGSGFVLRQAIAAAPRAAASSACRASTRDSSTRSCSAIAFDKGLSFRMGQTHAQRFMPELLERIREGRLKPDVIVTHKLPLAEAARGYEIFDEKREDCRKGRACAVDGVRPSRASRAAA
jgi:threonine dehydrogenase-like Zn-dependent dehydrogenase